MMKVCQLIFLLSITSWRAKAEEAAIIIYTLVLYHSLTHCIPNHILAIRVYSRPSRLYSFLHCNCLIHQSTMPGIVEFNDTIGHTIPADTPHVRARDMFFGTRTAQLTFMTGRQCITPDMGRQRRLRRGPALGSQQDANRLPTLLRSQVN